jgi:hypothetical protein
VIESLSHNETTGEDLYNDIISRKKKYYHPKLLTELLQPNSKPEFFKFMSKVKKECTEDGIYPIIHFEIHGNKNKNGLVLNSNESITWKELVKVISEINIIIKNNLFITFAVCHGAYFLQEIKINKPSPYWGFIGSFDEIFPEDLSIRYENFYDEFLVAFDLTKAISRLHKSNPSLPSSYRFINSETTFKEVYANYLKEEFSQERIKKRAFDSAKLEGIKLETRPEKRRFLKKFRKLLIKSKEEYRKKHTKIFFMK